MVIVMWIIVGAMIPVWYYFTQVYRAPLPFESLDSLKQVGPILKGFL